MYLLTFLLACLMTCRAEWVLKGSNHVIEIGTTTHVQLNCSYDCHQGPSTEIKDMIRVRIFRQDKLGVKKPIAELRYGLSDPRREEEDSEVDGHFDPSNLATTFLNVRWPEATKNTVGTYGCSIDGYDADGDTKEEITNAVKIEEDKITLEDLIEIVGKLKSDFKKKHEDNRKKINDLKRRLDIFKGRYTRESIVMSGSLNKRFSTLQNDSQERESKLRQEIIDFLGQETDRKAQELKSMFEKDISTVAQRINDTDNGLYQQISTLKKEHEQLKEKFQKWVHKAAKASKIKETQSKGGADGMDPAELSNKIDDGQAIMKRVENDLLLTMKNVDLMDRKYEQITNELMVNVSQAGACTCQEESVEAAQWPEGNYALIEPQAGCPSGNASVWEHGWIQFHTESDFNHDAISDKSHFKRPVFRSDGLDFFFKVHFCLKTNSLKGTRKWPKGSYCLNRLNGKCPGGFQSGYIAFDEEHSSKQHKSVNPPDLEEGTGTIEKFFYCCRDDGDADIPIYLPKTKPFYLYRLEDTKCQRVVGMTAKEESLQVDTNHENNHDSFGSSDLRPFAQLHPVKIEMCYYTPKHGAASTTDQQ